MDAKLIQKNVPLESQVTFFLKGGSNIAGRFLGVEQELIKIESEKNQPPVQIPITLVSDWQLLPDNQQNGRNEVPVPSPYPISNEEISKADQSENLRINASPDEIEKKLVEIEELFQAKCQKAKIALKEFKFPDEDLKGLSDKKRKRATKVWNGIQKYIRNTNKLSEKNDFIQPITAELEDLANHYWCSALIKRHLAYFYTLSENRQDALENYRETAILSQHETDWYNLAVIAQEAKNEELACYSLSQVFQKLPATEDIEAWYLYVHLLLKFDSHRELRHICQTEQRKLSQDETELLLNTAVYILKMSGQEEMAREAIEKSITNDEISIFYVQEILNRLNRKPTEGYQSVEQEISRRHATYLKEKNLNTPQPIKEQKNSPYGPHSINKDTNSSQSSTYRRGRNHTQGNKRSKETRQKYANSSSVPSRESQQLYDQARVELGAENYSKARKLFQQAIKAGGGTQVYETFFRMLAGTKSRRVTKATQAEAEDLIKEAIKKFPEHINFYNMHGQMERRNKRYKNAEKIFRKGLTLNKRPGSDINLRFGLGLTLVEINTESSLKEADQIFDALEKKRKLNKDDNTYQRFKVFKDNERAKRAYDFFQSAGMRVEIPGGQRDLPRNINDIVVDIQDRQFEDSFGLTGSFLVRCFKHKSYPNQLVDLIRSLNEQEVVGLQSGGTRILNPSLAFIAVPEVNQNLRNQVFADNHTNESAIIPLDDLFFQEAKKEPRNAILGLLNQYLGQRDLYDSTVPVSGRRFFGRERLLLELTDEIHSGAFLGIYGLRKIGKTSLIHELRDEKLSEDVVAYVDLQEISGHLESIGNCNPLYWALEQKLYERLCELDYQEKADLLRLGKEKHFSDLPDNGTRAPLFFTEDIKAFLQALEAGKNRNIKRLVILIDELELILPGANEENRIDGYIEFFRILRGLAQTYQDLLSCVVVAANAAISESSYWEGRDNPVFALYNTHYLPPFPQKECAQMIRDLGKGMSVHWDEDAISAVFAETNGHPFLTRIFCSQIAQKFKDTRPLNVKAELVQDQIGDFIRYQGDKLNQIIELLEVHFPEEKEYLENIALEKSPPKMPDEALRHLMGYHLIEEKDGGYRMTLNLLRRWLRRRAGIRE